MDKFVLLIAKVKVSHHTVDMLILLTCIKTVSATFKTNGSTKIENRPLFKKILRLTDALTSQVAKKNSKSKRLLNKKHLYCVVVTAQSLVSTFW